MTSKYLGRDSPSMAFRIICPITFSASPSIMQSIPYFSMKLGLSLNCQAPGPPTIILSPCLLALLMQELSIRSLKR
ncbi:MAG: hypothetical protein QXY34_01510 [Candidatus Bathyarchaeia archaeon]